jgi:hypothetical protein
MRGGGGGIANSVVTPPAVWGIWKTLIKRGEPKASNAIHGPLYLTFHPPDKANATADCSENQFTSNGLVMETTNGKCRPHFKLCSQLQLQYRSLKFRKACGTDGIPNECLRYLPRKPLVPLKKKKKTPCSESASELYRPSDRRLSAK